MLFKLLVLIFLAIILYSLGSALFYLVRDRKTDETRVVKALTWRIGLSIFLFCLLMVAYMLGWIAPHTV